MNQNYFEPNLSYSGFDQPSQYPIDQSPPQEMSIQDMDDLKQQCLDEWKSMIIQIQIKDYRNERIDIRYRRECEIKIDELKGKFNGMSIKINKKKELRQLEQAANVSNHTPEPSRRFNSIYYDDKESSIAITPDFPIMNSLIMEDELLDTIPETELDEENESSVEDLNLTPSESEDLSEDLSDIERECDMPVCDDFTTFSNHIFDSNDDFTSSDDESLSDEDVLEENFKIYLNPLFDEEIISTKIDPHHFNAESDLIESLLNRDTSIVSSPKFDSLLKEFSELNSENSNAVIESFSPYPIPVEGSDSLIEEINIFLAPDDSIPPGIKKDDYDSEGDILFLKELLSNDSFSLPKNKSFHFDRYYDPSSHRPPAKPPDDDGIHFDIELDTGILTAKVVDDISEHYVLIPSILPTHPTRCPVINTLLPFSSENENKVFNSGILASNEEKSPHLLSHWGFKAFRLIYESPMMISGGDIPILDVLFLHFYPP
ncbi:hypothetical protein Tco_1221071 [Tanacetum coccineum]